jgi:hypothetical protein
VPTIKVRVADQVLQQKGFKKEDDRDHVYYFYLRGGKKTGISTKISHGEKDLTDDLCKFMARQTKLTLSEFRSLIDCPMTPEMYLEHLIKGNHLPKDPPTAKPSDGSKKNTEKKR